MSKLDLDRGSYVTERRPQSFAGSKHIQERNELRTDSPDVPDISGPQGSKCKREPKQNSTLDTQHLVFQFESLVGVTKRQLELQGTKQNILLKLLCNKGLTGAFHDFENAEDLAEIFGILHHRGCITFLNYDLLTHIIETLGNETCKKKLKLYEANLMYYSESRLTTLPPDIFHCNNEADQNRKADGCEDWCKLAIKIEKDWKRHCLKDVMLAGRRVASILNLNNSDLHIASVEEGCILVTFFIPPFAAEKIMRQEMTYLQMSELDREKIIQIKCCLTNLYDSQKFSRLSVQCDSVPSFNASVVVLVRLLAICSFYIL